MLKEFIKKISEWTLQKEEELAKECKIPIETIEKQINTLKEKKEEVLKQVQEIDEIIQRLEKIKDIELLRCGTKK
jgi:chaperonin cofactor prefoldin